MDRKQGPRSSKCSSGPEKRAQEIARVPTATTGISAPWNDFERRQEYAMPRLVPATKIRCAYDEPGTLVNSVVGVLQSEGGGVREHLDDRFAGKLECCEVVVKVGSKAR